MLDREVLRGQLITRRTFFLATGKVGLLAMLFSRMFYLQIIKGSDYKVLSDKNRISLILIPPTRGTIFDRQKIPISENRPSYSLKLDKRRNKDYLSTIEQIFLQTNLTDEEKKSIYFKLKKASHKTPSTIINDIDWNLLANVEEKINDLHGIFIEEVNLRKYNFPHSFSHLTGYVGKISEKETKEAIEEFSSEFQVGKTGIEREYEEVLQGKYGYKKIEVDAKGNFINQIEKISPKPGDDLLLNIDSNLQNYIYSILPAEGATAIVMDIHTGELTSLCSTPTYDPNKFVGAVELEYWKSLVKNPLKPLINKTTQAQYPPGSTFKLITILAGLESGLKPEQRFTCTGQIELGKRPFRCWNKNGHGSLDMRDSIKHSCNCYMFNVVKLIGADKILDTAKIFGFGKQTNIDLPSELSGFVPDANWKLKNFKLDWSMGDSFNISIGQGAILATPIQQTKMIAAFASSGKLHTPKLARLNDIKYGEIGIKAEHFEFIKNSMYSVVNEPGGTGFGSRSLITSLAGKTGTSQVVAKKSAYDDLSKVGVRRERRNHALFAGFTPFENPKYAINVIVDHGGSGGTAAGPIARNIAEYIYINKL